MLYNYIISEIVLVLKRYKVLSVYVLYFAVPAFFFHILISPLADQNNLKIINQIGDAIFLTLFIIVLQFWVFTKVVSEYKQGIISYKFSFPLSKFSIIIGELCAEIIFGVLFLFTISCFNMLFQDFKTNNIICAAILIAPLIIITHSYSLLFFSQDENVFLASIFAFFSVLPLLFFIGNIINDLAVTQNIYLAALYAAFISVIYIIKMGVIANNISI